MKLRPQSAITTFPSVIVSLSILAALFFTYPAVAQNEDVTVPPYQLDALEGFVWSSTDLFLAPGQAIIITNRDVARHTFTVDAWGTDLNLPSLISQETSVPMDAEVGAQFEFYSSIPGDKEGGLVGTITIVTAEDVIAGTILVPNLGQSNPEPRIRIETRDDFTFQPAIVTVAPGTIIEIANTGVISHHFAVDKWGVNETIAPGNIALVRVPDDVENGSTIDFYCSVPGHAQQGMVGIMRVSNNANEISTVIRTSDGRTERPIDMRPFVPDADDLGNGWSQVRTGSSESILGDQTMNPQVFPYSGMGAVYVGPGGARVTLVVLPLNTEQIPVSQISDSVRSVQDSMASSWSVDRIASAAWRSVSPPNGCTVSERISGIVPIITLPGGITSCQLTGVGVALFVAVEGEYDGRSGVIASDMVVSLVISGEAVVRVDD